VLTGLPFWFADVLLNYLGREDESSGKPLEIPVVVAIPVCSHGSRCTHACPANPAKLPSETRPSLGREPKWPCHVCP